VPMSERVSMMIIFRVESCEYILSVASACAAGVPGELYYVSEGQVNDYALGFTLPLHTNVTRLFFDWFDDSSATDPPVKLRLKILSSVN